MYCGDRVPDPRFRLRFNPPPAACEVADEKLGRGLENEPETLEAIEEDE